jgi:DnaJ family protein C protein 11
MSTNILLTYKLTHDRFTRLGQKVTLPIILSSEFDLTLAFLGTLIPASAAIALEQLILKPRRQQKIQE